MCWKNTLNVCAVIAAFSPALAHGTLISYEGFSYDEAELIGQAGGTGFTEEWSWRPYPRLEPVSEEMRVVPGSLEYQNLETEGNHFYTSLYRRDGGPEDQTLLGRPLAESISRDETVTRYLSFLVRGEESRERRYMGIFLVNNWFWPPDLSVGTNYDNLFGLGSVWCSDIDDCTFVDSDVSPEVGETSLLVVKAELRPGPDQFTLYVNPLPGNPEPTEGTVKGDFDVGDVREFVIAGDYPFSVDEIRWGETFADVTPVSESLPLDFNSDGELSAADIDMLTAQIARETSSDPTFDLTNDGTVDGADLTRWRTDAATHNGFSAAYLFGDANLDGSVNATDLNNLALNWQQGVALWSAGDFTADGIIDSSDLNQLALHWESSVPVAASTPMPIPEPSAVVMSVLGLTLICGRFRKT